ncbi:MAG: hypothetical protein AAF235_11335 [Planctomycetota bacterium]
MTTPPDRVARRSLVFAALTAAVATAIALAPSSSVAFAMDDVLEQTESVPPFALLGNSGGDVNAGALTNGVRTITATPTRAPRSRLARLSRTSAQTDVNDDTATDVRDVIACDSLADAVDPAADLDGSGGLTNLDTRRFLLSID